MFKGIKDVPAAGLVGEVGDFRRFKTLSEVMKLAGLDLFEISFPGNTKGGDTSPRKPSPSA